MVDAALPTGGPLPEVQYSFLSMGDPGTTWRVVAGTLREGLSEVYEAVLDLCTADVLASPDALLGAPAALGIGRGALERRVCGVVAAVEDLGWTAARRVVRVRLVPELWALSQRTNYRIFQDVDVIDAVLDVLRDAGIYQGDRLVQDLRRGDYARREYLVQFRETDLAFVLRLLELEGVTFHFRHEGEREALVLADGDARPWTPALTLDGGPVPILEGGGPTASVETVRRFDWRRALQPTSVTLRDYNFTNPGTVLDMTRSAPRDAGARPIYDYPGPHTLEDYAGNVYGSHDGQRLADLGQAAFAARASTGSGRSWVTGFAPGTTFALIGHGVPELEARYLLTRVHHTFHNEEELAHDAGDRRRVGERYENRFECLAVDTTFRPTRSSPRPVVQGPQTAKVMALPNSTEEICVDHYGRILVQFHWDRPDQRSSAQRPKQSSCWVRVAQSWAGSQWGAVVIPRVGMEVVVHFLDGDPDRPLVTGCVYNGANNPPLNLPAERTRSTFKTNSSPGGGGFNELTFEDLADNEKVFLHAQKDLEEIVLNDHSTTVHRDQTNHVKRHQTENVDVNQRLTVGNDRTKTVHRDETMTVDRHQTLTVKVNRSKTVQGNETETVQGNQTSTVVGNRTESVTGNDALAVTGMQSLTVASTRMKSVTGTEVNTILAGRLTMVTGFDVTVVLGAAGLEVVGAYNVSALASITMLVAPSVVSISPGKFEVTAPTKIELTSGSSKVTMEPGKIVLTSGAGATIELSGADVKINGAKVTAEGSAEANLKSAARVNVEGMLTTIKGSPVKVNC